ncbi:MAG: lysophospholipid acyltransferase family protein [Pirellulales bacterium]|nr:lysophospholipid acyltransferase family protein [Pirellulales bacterium]
MQIKRLSDGLVYGIVRSAIALVQALSLETCQRLAVYLAYLAYRFLRIRRAVIDENLKQAFPNLSDNRRADIGQKMWEHLFLMVCELAHAPRKIHVTNWRDHSLIHPDQIVRILLSERPVVMLSGHFGNFELGGYLLGMFGFPTHSIARPLDNPYLDRFVNSFRGTTGQRMLVKEGSRDQIAELLRQGATLALLGDQAAGNKACWVDFFGRPASTHKAVAILSLAAEAPMMVMYAQRLAQPLCYRLALEDAVDPKSPQFAFHSVPEMAQWYTDCLERIIVRAPEQYWWLHRRWKGQPSNSALKRLAKRRITQAA